MTLGRNDPPTKAETTTPKIGRNDPAETVQGRNNPEPYSAVIRPTNIS